MDETLTREPGRDLPAMQAKLDAARDEADALRALLALRTHQYDAAWQDARRLEGELTAVREALAEARLAAEAAVERADRPPEPAPEAVAALAGAREETEAVRTVLGAVLDCIGRRALDRRRFQDIVTRAGRETPAAGPAAARHAVLLAEARRVLGVPG